MQPRRRTSPIDGLQVAAVCFGSLVFASAAGAQVTPSGASEIQVSATASFQAAPAVASDGGGGAITVVWQRQGAGGWAVFARRYKLDAANQPVPLGAELQVNTLTGGCRQLPAVAADAGGNFVVAWQSDQDPGGGSGIYARRFSSTGVPLDATEFRVNTTAASDQTRPAVAMAPDGSFVVVWQSDSQAGGQGWDIAAQAFTPAGAASGSEALVNSSTAGAQSAPRVAFVGAPSPGFAVVWQSAGGIFARRIGLSGVAIDGAEFQVNATGGGFLRRPAIGSDPSGNYAVAWESTDANGLTSRIQVRRFQGASAIGGMGDLTLDSSPAATRQHGPEVAQDAIGNWVVTWDSSGEDGNGTAVLAAQLSNRQVPVGPKVVLDVTLTAGDQGLPAVVMTQGGKLLIAWQSVTPAVDGAVIEARSASLPGESFYTLAPCRLIDTRGAIGSLGGPRLASGVKRVFPVVALGGCGIPVTARVLSVNVTAVDTTGPGSIALFPGDAPFTGTSTVNFNLSKPTIANNAHLILSRDGAGTIAALAAVSGGTNEVDLVVDVNGYYQ